MPRAHPGPGPVALGVWVCAAALIVAGCSSDGGDTQVRLANARVAAKQKAVTKAESEAAAATAAFCGASKDYIVGLDRYGDVLNATAPTVGDVKDAGSELAEPAQEAADAAEAAVSAQRELESAKAELADAQAALAIATSGAGQTSGTGKASGSGTPTTAAPLVPTATVNRVKQANADFESARSGITDQTPLSQASQQFNAAAVALEMSWLQLFADAGCLTDEQDKQAEAAVHDYTAALQDALAAAGYYKGKVDGVYGPTTVDAVEALQKAHGLPVTGTVDKATDAALTADLQAKGGAAAQQSLASTAAVQQTLKLAGFWDGPVDGQWTPALTEALKSFQTKLGVKPTGTVDAATVAALEKAIENAKPPDTGSLNHLGLVQLRLSRTGPRGAMTMAEAAAPTPSAVGQAATTSPATGGQTSTPTSTPTAEPTGTPSTTTTERTPTPSTTQSARPTASNASPRASVTAHATSAPSVSQPAAATSTLPPATIVVAVGVLALAVLFLVVASRRASRTSGGHSHAATRRGATADAGQPDDVVAAGDAAEPVEQQETVAFLVALGRAMVDSGDPVTHIEDTLRRVAHTNGVSAAGIVVMPTALMVSLPGEHDVTTSVTVAGGTPLRLDQIDAVYAVADAAARGQIGPRQGLSLLQSADSSPAPFTALATVAGHALLTVGLAIIIGGSSIDFAIAAVLGTAVGVARVATSRVAFAFQVFVPVLSAFTVAVVVFLLPRTGLDFDVLAPLIAPLVMFLPGALLTTSVIELATGQMVSGASRLAAGLMQLTLLALGILVAARLVGVPATRVTGAGSSPLGDLAPWLGVALFGLGVVVHRCARREAAGWIILVLYVAYAGQVLGGFVLGGTLSAFIGALLMTPYAVYVSRLPSAPATMVSFLPAFWLLVPGALGLVGITQILGPSRTSGFDSLVTTGAAMIGIAFGVLLGLAAATGLGSLARLAPRGKRAAYTATHDMFSGTGHDPGPPPAR